MSEMISNNLQNTDEVSSKLIELEDRSRRNNLRIDGIEETPIETWKIAKLKYKN